jgi:predicted RNase H-like nuclease (RuvC/YqgF family)
MNGGPKEFRCPYPTCKRNKNPFSRRENLNEHCRRVHTDEAPSAEDKAPAEDTHGELDNSCGVPGKKRKREKSGDAGWNSEAKALRQENDRLRRQVEEQQREMAILQTKITELQGMLARHSAPAPVLIPTPVPEVTASTTTSVPTDALQEDSASA